MKRLFNPKNAFIGTLAWAQSRCRSPRLLGAAACGGAMKHQEAPKAPKRKRPRRDMAASLASLAGRGVGVSEKRRDAKIGLGERAIQLLKGSLQ